MPLSVTDVVLGICRQNVTRFLEYSTRANCCNSIQFFRGYGYQGLRRDTGDEILRCKKGLVKMAFMKAAALPLSGCQHLRLLFTAPHFVNSHHVSSPELSNPSCSLRSASRRVGITSHGHGNGTRYQVRMRENLVKVFASGYGGEEQVAVKEVSDEDYDKKLQDSDTSVLAAVKSR